MTTGECDFRRLQFKTPEVVDRNWLDWFREEFSRGMFQSDVSPEMDRPFRLDATMRLLPGLALYSGEASPMRTVPTAEFRKEEVFGLIVALGGEMSLHNGVQDIRLEPGSSVFGRPADMLQTRSDTKVLSVRLSPRLLAALVPNLSELSFLPIASSSQPIRLLVSYLRMLDKEESIETPEARQLAVQHVHDLVALAVRPSRDIASGHGVRAARLAAIKQDILSNLADQSLSVEAVAARHALTPRYIHMLFEAEGVSFTTYVVNQRLARAHRMLGDARFSHQSISTIALAVGFGDISYFNRTFRRRFGATPSDVRQRSRQQER